MPDAAGEEVAAAGVAVLLDRRPPQAVKVFLSPSRPASGSRTAHSCRGGFQRRAGDAQAVRASIRRTTSAALLAAFLTVCASSRMSRW